MFAYGTPLGASSSPAPRAQKKVLSEAQIIALGFRPRTVSGWWFWFKYWSPLALQLLKWRRGE